MRLMADVEVPMTFDSNINIKCMKQKDVLLLHDTIDDLLLLVSA
eukprot:CAMPEP_0183736452 /NCGR_PEP_ID=MMETSP0737-20130205/49305_1 /TAXON_ID=385413 /ORGANISM="Thalassiosira miniscula, Strain CCMP1093" /LENGTH=43 /DNA_ID= /DNA_START= /DNA_END= /DNA_ORIENTATION=